MMDAIKLFLFFVDVFFVIYLIGYSTFLFLSVVVGASELYEKRMDEKMKGTLRHDFYIPISNCSCTQRRNDSCRYGFFTFGTGL